MKVQRVDGLDGTDRNGVAEADCPSKAEPGVVGSGEAVSLQTTPSLAREARPESSRSDEGDHPTDQRKVRERVQIQVIPRMMKRILEDGLGIQD